MVMTKITASPMPTALEVFFETPMKGHKPRKRASTILLTNTMLMTTMM